VCFGDHRERRDETISVLGELALVPNRGVGNPKHLQVALRRDSSPISVLRDRVVAYGRTVRAPTFDRDGHLLRQPDERQESIDALEASLHHVLLGPDRVLPLPAEGLLPALAEAKEAISSAVEAAVPVRVSGAKPLVARTTVVAEDVGDHP
jgi:hypothetical protein